MLSCLISLLCLRYWANSDQTGTFFLENMQTIFYFKIPSNVNIEQTLWTFPEIWNSSNTNYCGRFKNYGFFEKNTLPHFYPAAHRQWRDRPMSQTATFLDLWKENQLQNVVFSNIRFILNIQSVNRIFSKSVIILLAYMFHFTKYAWQVSYISVLAVWRDMGKTNFSKHLSK